MKSTNLCWVVVILVAGGCFGEGVETPDTVPVSGAVMYNGQPVPGATVSFMAEGAPRAATGVTNEAGEFQLSTFGANDGAIPGDHKITVTKVEQGETAAPPDPSSSDPAALTQSYTEVMQVGGGSAGPNNLLPQKYASQTTSPLNETVTLDGPNQFVLQLTD